MSAPDPHPFESMAEVRDILSSLYDRLDGREANAVQVAYRALDAAESREARLLAFLKSKAPDSSWYAEAYLIVANWLKENK